MSHLSTYTETHSDHSSPRNDDPCRVRDLALAVARDARVVPDVLVSNVADPQLCAVVKDAHSARRLYGVRVLVPQDLRCGSALRLAVKNNSIS